MGLLEDAHQLDADPVVVVVVLGSAGTGRRSRALRERYDMCVITNDIYTREDADFLVKAQALPSDRIMGVETGGCPHTAIREDCSINLAAIADMRRRHPAMEFVKPAPLDRWLRSRDLSALATFLFRKWMSP